jgi:alpha-tubulin suppressor-like RCC1 family protein
MLTEAEQTRFALLLGAAENAEFVLEFAGMNDAEFEVVENALRTVTGSVPARHLANTLTFAEVESPEGELITMACGNDYTMLITTAGLFACGQFGTGQLGIGGAYGVGNKVKFIKVATEGRPLAVSCGRHSTMLTTTAGLFATGQNHASQLGLGDQRDRLVFERVAIAGTPISVVSGAKHSMAITTAGLFACGSNKVGQLGFTNHAPFPLFTEVLGVEGRPLSVGCGSKNATHLITTAGLLGAGKNYEACVGFGNRKWWSDLFRGVETSPHGKPLLLASSYTHTMLITTRGLFGCGLNRNGELGLGNRAESYSFEEVPSGPDGSWAHLGKPIFVACGDSFTFLLTERELLSTGDNSSGQLGLGSRLRRKTFHAIELDLFPEEVPEAEPERKRQRTGCHICGLSAPLMRQEVERPERVFCSAPCQRRYHWFSQLRL